MGESESVHLVSRPPSTRTVFILTILGCGLLIAPGIFWNFEYDQGTFAYGGHALLDGARAYIDFWDIKPPNIFYTYAAGFGFFGESVRAIRLIDFGATLLMIGLLYLLGMRIWRECHWRALAASAACFAYAMQYNILGPHDTAQVESFALPWILLSVLLILRDDEGWDRQLQIGLAGFCVAIAFFFKYPTGIYLLLLAGILVWRRGKESLRITIFSLVFLGVGFVVGFGLQIAQLALLGELDELWRITRGATLNYVSTNYSGTFGLIQNLRTLVQNLDVLWSGIALLGWSTLIVARPRERRLVKSGVMILAFGLLLSLIAVQAQNKGYRYHYLIAFPWVDLLMGGGIAGLAVWIGEQLKVRSSIVISAIIALLFLGSAAWVSRATLGEKVTYSGALIAGDTLPNGYIEGDKLSERVQTLSSPTDSIFIFGFQPYVYWRAARQPATPYLNTIHFKPENADSTNRALLTHRLLTSPPQLFLVDGADSYTSQGNSNLVSREVIRRQYPELDALLNSSYHSVDTIRGMIIYRRSGSNVPHDEAN